MKRARIRVAPMTVTPSLRLATLDDADPIDELMKVSTRAIFPAFYDRQQTEASIQFIASVDHKPIEDGTYFERPPIGPRASRSSRHCGGTDTPFESRRRGARGGRGA
jgi:hypothetical protein